jgi:hypothetical protein
MPAEEMRLAADQPLMAEGLDLEGILAAIFTEEDRRMNS